MAVLISGSLAYDYIMDFPDSFKNHILPDQLHILSVSFVVDQLKKNFGGTAGNIGYTMKLLGGEPIITAPLGSDGGDYFNHLKKYHIATDHIFVVDEVNTASAHIVTDKDDNQITAFYPGALNEIPKIMENLKLESIELAIIAATKKETMIEHAKICYEQKIPMVFDPGQQMTALDARELCMLIGQAKFLIANDYEMKLMQEKTEWDMEEMLKNVEMIITTRGEKGSTITHKEGSIDIAPCPPMSVDDPTGAGDAYRAGFFTAYVRGENLKTCGQVASVAATYAVEHYGTQNHMFTKKEFAERYRETYGEEIYF